MQRPTQITLAASVLLGMSLAAPSVRADVVTDWNIKANEMVVEAKLGTPPAMRVLAIVHTAVYEAANAVTRRYPAGALKLDAAPEASLEAAVATANRATLVKLLPSVQPAVDSAYQAALAKVADGPAKAAGIAVGEKAAAAVLADAAEDKANAAEAYRPHTTPGTYVPTVVPAVTQWPQRKPWVMSGPAQFRPGPPPSLNSELWARDYNEIKAIGSRNSTSRSAEQTAIARFWDYSLPPVYHGVVRSVTNQPGRDPTQNARLFMAATQASDDAAIAIFDAKYHYNFWRPVTAIRNGDTDGNDATERDASWTPFIDTPMHPEYPCAHCVLAAAVGTVLQAEIGAGPVPLLTTTSPTANGAARSWTSTADFMQEVASARIYDGVHYRNSTVVGSAIGKKVGELVAAKYFRQD
ncbi:vanadium-dependent haloperoxidase [Ramlibacter tataouinensis]|uniref:PA-phosphatase n=1 Tax=Ramlibacter tataouinensis TaxID=94132 RepID=A0A127JRC5_9BURK|nr:vanadium-dependent haloperoxidase [Ramlibacter tataouinensis]AMO22548.1 PA-phosphatase [Ramlibacter tataouinensis]